MEQRQYSAVTPDVSLALANLYQNAPGRAQFWSEFVSLVRQVAGAEHVLVMERLAQAPWQATTAAQATQESPKLDPQQLMQVADAAVVAKRCHSHVEPDALWLAVPLACGARVEDMNKGDAVLVLMSTVLDADVQKWLAHWLTLVAQLPRHQSMRTQLTAWGPGQQDAQRLYDMLRLGLRASECDRFMAAAFVLCNELVVRMHASHVMLGWVRQAEVHLCAISQVEKFDVKSEASRTMVEAMEEVVDQDRPVTFPSATNSRVVNRAHGEYTRTQTVDSLSSVPIRWRGDVVGVLAVERAGAALTDAELWELDLIAQVCVHQLVLLEQRSKWWGMRLWIGLREAAAQWLEPKHVGWKMLGVAVLCSLALSAVLPWTYRIEAGASLQSKDLLFIPAPFDGYLNRVFVDIGDVVNTGDLLVALDTRDLEQEVRMANADLARYRSEAEKAQAQRNFAEMQIARALEQQAEAKVTLVQYQLDNAQVRAPLEGTVIEGELKKNLGSPVRKGDLLLKLAQNRDTYLELVIDQYDVHELTTGMQGEVAFVGRPEERFPVTVASVDPVAISRDGRNVFIARAHVQAQAGWRPGMGGTAKLDAGKQPLLWILTRRTVRYLREVFWL
jgi:multidrug efflux pump subunit AcrA (membrane-fusion protein)